MNKAKLISQKRIIKDIKEIRDNPLEGIGITEYNNNIMEYIVNIKLQSGIYNGYCIQLLLTFNENYPTKPPKILIFPGQELDGRYHHHIFDEYSYGKGGFKKFCFDLLDNDFMNVNEAKTGWNPSYTISSLLLQVQNFLSDPDMEESHLPNKDKIIFLLNSNKTYKKIFKDIKGNDIIHTWKNPYPKMYFKDIDNDNNKNKEIHINKKNDEKRLEKIKQYLTCFTLKLNYIDAPEILLGYPIVRYNVGRNKIELYPIPELLSYDAYISQFEKEQKLENYFDIPFKSANNEFYNAWVPIYINEEHYKKNKSTILNSFSVMKYGPLGIKEYDFKAEQIFEILPIILNKMIIGIFKNENALSEAFIICYFHYILLFKKLVEEFKEEFDNYVKKYLNQIKSNNYDFDKQLIPDIGNFMMLLFFSDLEITEKMWNCLFQELFIRQMYWTFHGNECKYTMKQLIFDTLDNKELNLLNNNKDSKQKNVDVENVNDKIMNLKDNFHNNKVSKQKNGEFENVNDKIMNLKDNFQFCDNKGLLDDIIDGLSKDENINKLYNENKKQNNLKISVKTFIKNELELENNFKEFIDKSSEDLNKKIANLIVKKRGLFFLLSDNNNNKKKSTKKKEIYDNKPIPYNSKDYDNLKVDNLLSKMRTKNSKDVLKYAYTSQRGNQLLLITFMTKKKMDEKNFIDELKKNYGVFLEVESFIKDMKKKLNEIQSYKSLYEYINCNILNDKSEMEYFIESYKKAKDKSYIKEYKYNSSYNNENDSLDNNEIIRSSNSIFTRGGRGRGRRGRAFCSICGGYH